MVKYWRGVRLAYPSGQWNMMFNRLIDLAVDRMKYGVRLERLTVGDRAASEAARQFTVADDQYTELLELLATPRVGEFAHAAKPTLDDIRAQGWPDPVDMWNKTVLGSVKGFLTVTATEKALERLAAQTVDVEDQLDAAQAALDGERAIADDNLVVDEHWLCSDPPQTLGEHVERLDGARAAMVGLAVRLMFATASHVGAMPGDNYSPNGFHVQVDDGNHDSDARAEDVTTARDVGWFFPGDRVPPELETIAPLLLLRLVEVWNRLDSAERRVVLARFHHMRFTTRAELEARYRD